MSTSTTPLTPQGPVPAIGVPNSQDYARLVFAAPYFDTIPIAEILEPSVQEAVEGMLPGLVPPYVSDAANTAVQNLAVLLSGSTMSGPLFLNALPTQPTQAADKQYVDLMVATSGIPEVPTVPTGQTWARQTGQWVPIASAEGTFLPLSGGTMGGIINMGGNAINNLPAVPNLPNGAAPAQWVLNSIAASSLYQGTWDVDTYQPDLTQPQYHQNNFSWIAITTSTTGVVVSPPIPGLQGMTIYNGDTIIYSANAGGVFQAIHAGGLSLSEADARYLQLAGGQMGGALLLFEDPVSNMEAATRQWVLAQIGSGGVGEAPTDGQIYGRNGNARDWMPVVGLGGATLSGPLFLAANAVTALGAVPLQQLQSTVGNYVPLTGNATVTGPITMAGVSANLTLNSNASANLQAVPLQQLTSTLGSYLTATAAAGLYVPLTGNVNITGNIGLNTPIPSTIAPPGVNGAQILGYVADFSNYGVNAYFDGTNWRRSSATLCPGVINSNPSAMVMAIGPPGAVGSTVPLPVQLTLDTGGNLIITGEFEAASASFTGSCNAGGSTIGGVQLNGGLVAAQSAQVNGNLAILGGTYINYNTPQQVNCTGSVAGSPNVNNGASWGIPGYAWFQVASYAFPNESDPRNKRDMVPAEAGALDKVKAIPVYNFVYANDPTGKLVTGFDATEVRQHHNHAVMVGEDEAQTLAINLPDMIALLWQSVQELSAEVTALKAA